MGCENEATFGDTEHAKGNQRQSENESHCPHVLPPPQAQDGNLKTVAPKPSPESKYVPVSLL